MAPHFLECYLPIHFVGTFNNITQKSKTKNLDPKKYLKADNTYEFLTKVGDGIDTGKLESNVSDLYIVLKSYAVAK